MRGDHGHRITTTRANAHGIVAYHYFGTEDDRSIDVTVGGRIDTTAGRRAYLTSSKRGRLKTGVATRGYSLHAELGYGFDLGDHVVLVPRVRLRGPNISVDKFTDAVNARVSFEDIGRLIGGFGLTVHSTLPVDGGEIWLRGALDLWMAAIAGTASRSASV